MRNSVSPTLWVSTPPTSGHPLLTLRSPRAAPPGSSAAPRRRSGVPAQRSTGPAGGRAQRARCARPKSTRPGPIPDRPLFPGRRPSRPTLLRFYPPIVVPGPRPPRLSSRTRLEMTERPSAFPPLPPRAPPSGPAQAILSPRRPFNTLAASPRANARAPGPGARRRRQGQRWESSPAPATASPQGAESATAEGSLAGHPGAGQSPQPPAATPPAREDHEPVATPRPRPVPTDCRGPSIPTGSSSAAGAASACRPPEDLGPPPAPLVQALREGGEVVAGAVVSTDRPARKETLGALCRKPTRRRAPPPSDPGPTRVGSSRASPHLSRPAVGGSRRWAWAAKDDVDQSTDRQSRFKGGLPKSHVTPEEEGGGASRA